MSVCGTLTILQMPYVRNANQIYQTARTGEHTTTITGIDRMTKQCFYCSYPNSDDAKRCVNCGIELKTYWDKSGEKPKLVKEKR